jgi:hypothetical protein
LIQTTTRTITRSALNGVLNEDDFPQTLRLVKFSKVVSAFRRSFTRFASMHALRLGTSTAGRAVKESEERGMTKAIQEYVRDGNLHHRLDWLEQVIQTGRTKAEVSRLQV